MLTDGIFVVNKPVGPTSFDVVRQFKKIFPKTKVGHAGSLDPFAQGVLLILLGGATKQSEVLMNSDKVYRAKLALGALTDSYDRTGKVVQTGAIPQLSADRVLRCFQTFLGEWLQEPPMFSAKKVQGVPLYKLARKEVSIERQRAPVRIYKLEIIEITEESIFFEVHCSKGTYIRSLGKEIAERLGTVGHLTELERVSSGEYHIGQASSIESIQKAPTQELALAHQRFLAKSQKV